MCTSPLTLYRTVLSPPGRAVLMLCEDIALRVNIKEVNVLRGETRTLEFMKGSGFFLGKSGPSKKNVKDLEWSYGVVEAYLQSRQFVAADRLTLADYSVGSTATAVQGMHKTDPNKFPRCADWLARLGQEPVFKTISAPGVAYATTLLEKAWENNKNKK